MKLVTIYNKLFEDNDLLKLDRGIRQFSKTYKSMDRDAAEEKLGSIYDNYSETFDKIASQFVLIISKAIDKKKYPYAEFKWNRKSLSSIIDKVLNRGKDIIKIPDIVRGALLFDRIEEVEEWVKRFRRTHGDIITKYEEKGKGSDPVYGYYGTHHLDLNIDGLTVELQVATKKLWHYKNPAHALYQKTRSSGVSDQDRHLSKQLFWKGNQPNRGKYRESIERLDALWENKSLLD